MVAGALLVAGLLAGCGEEAADTLDRTATQAAVGRVVGARVHASATKTSCPGELMRGRGRSVDCRVTLRAVGTVRVRVRQVDDDAKLDVTLLDAVLDRALVTVDLKKHLHATFDRSFQADCGTGRFVAPPGKTLRCKARDRSGRRTVEATVVEAAGTLRYRVLP